jgi:hypothetical protein
LIGRYDHLPGRAAEGENRHAASGDRQSDDALRVQHMAFLAHEAAVQGEEVDRTASPESVDVAAG